MFRPQSNKDSTKIKICCLTIGRKPYLILFPAT